MSKVFISAIMPNLNGGKYIRRSVDAFINNMGSDCELIFVDGKSTDSSHEIISEYVSKYPNMQWVQDEDIGISSAFNMGVRKSSGSLLHFVPSDDVLLPGTYDKIKYFYNHINFDAIYYDSYSYYVEERAVEEVCRGGIPFTKESLLNFGTIVGLQNILFKRNVLEDDFLDEDNKYCMDYEFYLRTLDKKYFYFHMNDFGMLNYIDGNVSTVYREAQSREYDDVRRRYGYVTKINNSPRSWFSKKLSKIISRKV